MGIKTEKKKILQDVVVAANCDKCQCELHSLSQLDESGNKIKQHIRHSDSIMSGMSGICIKYTFGDGTENYMHKIELTLCDNCLFKITVENGGLIN